MTRRAWAELATLFLADAEVVVDRRNVEPLRLRGPGALCDFIRTAIEHFDLFEFTILNTVIEIEGERARRSRISRSSRCRGPDRPSTGRRSLERCRKGAPLPEVPPLASLSR